MMVVVKVSSSPMHSPEGLDDDGVVGFALGGVDGMKDGRTVGPCVGMGAFEAVTGLLVGLAVGSLVEGDVVGRIVTSA